MTELWQDLRYGLRTFASNRISTAVAIAVLSLGIGANAAIFSVTNSVLFRSLPYKNADRVVFVWANQISKGMRQQFVSAGEFRDIQARNQVLDGLGAVWNRSSVVTGGQIPLQIETAAVSPSVLTNLGFQPALGRSFAGAEDQPGKNHVALISAGIWQRRFGGDPEVLGKTLSIDGQSFTIVGVGCPQFRIPASESEIWIPYTPAPQDLLPANRGVRPLALIGRLRPGISLERAQGELRNAAAAIAQEYPDVDAGRSIDLIPLREQLIGDIRPTLWMMTAAVLALLLIACVNVAHLLLARAIAREREIAIRSALGANPARLVRQLLTESILLALLGGLLGILIAYWGSWLLGTRLALGLPAGLEVTVDWRVLAFTLAISVVTGIAFGLLPAFASIGSNLNFVLRSGGRGGTGGKARTRTRNILIAGEVASSTVLLICAGLLVRSLIRLQQVNPGFRTDHLLTMQLSPPQGRYAGLKLALFYQQFLDRVQRIPGAESAGICRFLPLSGNDASLNFQIEGQPSLSTADQPRAKFRAASGGYFRALGIPLIRGRLFDDRDDQHTQKVVVINQAAARLYWPGQDPIGKRILSGLDDNQWSTIIGVVGNVRHAGLAADPNPETYYQYLQIPPEAMGVAEGTMGLVIHTTADPGAITSAVRQELGILDPSQPVYNVRSMQTLWEASIAQPRLRALLIGTFAALALVLAALGLYGVMAYSVSQRTAELAIRAALGAEPGAILNLVISHATRLAGAGLFIGLAVAAVATRVITKFLFGISPLDPVAFGLASIVILAMAFLSALYPALRAAKVDPAIALRTE